MKKVVRYLVAGLAATLAVPAVADAAVVVQISQSGTDVVVTTSGTLNTAGLEDLGSYGLSVGVGGQDGYVGTGVRETRVAGLAGFTSTAGAFGTGDYASATSGSGTPFGFSLNRGSPSVVFVSRNYVSGTSLASTATFAGATIASLGLTEGRYRYASANDAVTIAVGAAAAVPEPVTWAMMMIGFGATGAALRRRRSVRVGVRYV